MYTLENDSYVDENEIIIGFCKWAQIQMKCDKFGITLEK